MKPPLHLQERNRARDYYNPLRGLDMPRIVRLLDAGERGEYSDLQWLYRTVEKRDSTVRGLKMRRTSALKKLDWDIKTPDKLPAGVTQTQADAQAASLRALYEGIENLPEVFEFLALASFRGYAHLEKRWQDDNPMLPLVRLQTVPQWHWVRDPETWLWRYDPTACNDTSNRSTPIDTDDFVIREIDDPINEIALICFLRKSMSQKDWDAFVEDFGIPSIFAVLGPNTPPDKVKEWLEVVERVTGNSRGALPPGSDVKSVAFGSQGDTPFKQHKDEQREELVLAGTGGLLTMLTAATGMNSEQAATHESAFNAIAIAEASAISAILQTQIDKPHLRREFPGQPCVAYFVLAAVDREDLDSLSDRLVKLAQAGLEADENEISEKMGLKLTRSQKTEDRSQKTEQPVPPPPFANRAAEVPSLTSDLCPLTSGFLAASAADLDAATRATLAPLIDRAAALAALSDDAAFAAAASKLQADLPALEKQILAAQPELETAFANIIATALRNGAESRGSILLPTDDTPFANSRRGYHDLRDELGRFAPLDGGSNESRLEPDPKENQRLGDKAVDIALRRRADVKNAMYRRDLGTVDFEWGRPGHTQPNAEGKTHTDGYGISHIHEKHGGKALRAVPATIAHGKILPHETDPSKRIVLHDGWKAVVQKSGKAHSCILTNFDPDEGRNFRR